jgi:uncharacterized protein
MKFSFCYIFLLWNTLNYCFAQDITKDKTQGYEMKQYFFVMLNKGSNREQDSASSAKIQEGHMANIRRLA